ncbi:Indoleamine 2,3-dioxygenase [Pseudomassariella vexata]|uniref:Indoleamine 2,3-dioxygenase n=1 Tax=Pseudomassariella vexata TaxID=1141098 RepID=A0A1Y2DDT1_9PEZI|nr:Indoleamine 2,3-dioxygenase [Pseudomassariella vexata]ORY57431.1 Indoleamine 2,3-dioxygenase [Pseudomassariella vexata]
MSPHAVPPSTLDSHTATDEYLLNKFAVTCNGFLPADAPLSVLPSDHYQPWEQVIQQLPVLLSNGTLRERIEALPVLSTEYLSALAEWRRAYVIMAFFTHAYVWAGPKAAANLPASISIPFLKISQFLELPPILAYAASNLWNFTSTGSDFTDLKSIRCLHTFTGTDDEHWFFMVSVAMEAQTACIIPVMMRALEAVKSRDYAIITNALEELSSCIEKVGALLERMYEGCDPDVFYHQIRPYLAGSKNMEAAGLPNGVFYPETKDGKGSWKQLRGGSNGQSSIIQFFDIVLGVQHKHEGTTNPRRTETDQPPKAGPTFHEEVREYMPGPHKRFLIHVSRMGSIHELALIPPTTTEQEQFCAAYKRTTETLGEFRNKHIKLVTMYIVLPSKRASCRGVQKQNLATASSTKMAADGEANKAVELKGTGGTTLIPFLKQSRDETLEAGVLRAS